MDILSLSLQASPEAGRSFGPEKGPESGFSVGIAGAKGLAPPGLGPPPNPLKAKSGEEGATPELTAPSQIPDFSPDLLKEIQPGESTIPIDRARPASKPVQVGLPKPSDDSTAALKTFACLGVISVPFEPLPVPVQPAIDAASAKPQGPFDGERPKAKSGIAFDKPWLQPLIADGWTKAKKPLVDQAGERPKPVDGSRRQVFPVDLPIEPTPPEPLVVSFDGEKPKKLSGEEKLPLVTPKPGLEPSAGQVSLVSGSRPRIKPDDGAHLNSNNSKGNDIDGIVSEIAGSRPRPELIDLSQDVQSVPLIELPVKYPSQHVTDPFIPGQPEKTNGVAGEKPKKSMDADAASVDVAIKVPTKDDTEVAENAIASNRPLRPIPKQPVKPILEKEEVKIDRTESRPTAEAVAKPKPATAINYTIQKPDLTPRQADEVVRQVLDRVEALAASRSARKVTVHLDPKEFGSITLVVGRRGGEVDAEIYASSDRVRQALEINRPALAAGLDQRGIQLSSMTVGSELPHGSGRHLTQDAAHHHHQNLSHFERSETTTLSLDAIRGLARKTYGVDMWI